MSPSSAECPRTSSHCRHEWITLFSLTVGFCCGLLGLISQGQAQPPLITSSGLHTEVTLSATPPAGNVQYDITGGTRPGGASGTNLFHSFGEFSVPSKNIANFLNAGSIDLNGHVLASNLPTSNILGRVTGGDPSSIFGMIQTNGPNGFGTANLFLMNPAGFLFGPKTTVNVGGMMTFTTADYLRFQGTDTLFNKVSTPESLSPLSTVPVAAFGFLGSNPAAIAIQGSTLQVAQGQTLSFVGGNQGFTAMSPDSGSPINVPGGVTMTGGTLLAHGGQINLASVASHGEVSAFDFTPTSGMTMGKIRLSQGALLDVSADAAGMVRIRGGQFVIDNAKILADTGNTDSAPTAIDIQVTDAVSLTTTSLSALTARTFGAGNAGDIMISSGSLNATFGTGSLYVSLIDSHTSGTGHGGNVTIGTGTGRLTVNAIPTAEGRVFITSGTGREGDGGKVTITAGDIELTETTIDTGNNLLGGAGSGGALKISASSLVLDAVTLSTDSISNKAGALNLESTGLFQATNSSIGSTSLLGENPVTVKADKLVFNNSLLSSATAFADAGDLTITARVIELSNGSIIATQTLGDGNSGNIHITASERVSLNGPNDSTPSGIFTSSLGDPDFGIHGNAGHIEIDTPRLELTNGGQINSTTFTSGRGGDVRIIHANSVLITGERPSEIGQAFFAEGGTRASGIYSKTLGTDLCSSSCGNAGNINITTGSLMLQNGGLIDSGTTNNGQGGSIDVSATGQILLSGTMANGTPGGISSRTVGTLPDSGAGGIIALTAGQSVAISNGGSVSASSSGPGNTGNIVINAGQAFTATNSNSAVTTEANQASGGTIKITTTPSGTVQLTNSTISASVLNGTGGGGSVNIDPQYVLLQNSQILAQAVQGPGGNIFITTNLLLPDANSVISASSQFGVNGTVTIQSPNAPISGQIQPLGKTPLLASLLLNQHCASLADGQFSSFTVGGRDSLPTEPGSWLASPLAFGPAGFSAGAVAEGGAQMRVIDPVQETTVLSLRQIAPAGFLTQAFAVEGSASCQS